MSTTGTGLSKETNEQRQERRLRREIQRQHAWRVQTWATAELYIKERQAKLAELGFAAEDLFEPDFSNQAMVEEYANRTAAS